MTLFFTAQRYSSVVYAVIVSLSVCLSVRHKPVLYRNDETDRAGMAWELPLTNPKLDCKEIRVPQK